MADLAIHNSYTLRNWVSLHQRKLQTGLFVSPAMTRTQKRDVQALQQRNEELGQTLQDNLLAGLKLLILFPRKLTTFFRIGQLVNPGSDYRQTVNLFQDETVDLLLHHADRQHMLSS